tara:strand:+ start:719 stop:832 length:114 start_codon:yes stop_codon:yes gene_type:complete
VTKGLQEAKRAIPFNGIALFHSVKALTPNSKNLLAII